MTSDNRETTGLEVAIIALAGRYPGASDPEALWSNLRDGIEPISVFTPEELAQAGVPAPLLASDNYVPSGFVLDDIEQFDAGFFGFAPSEAELLDPQHRLFLECAWEAMEQAGYNPVEHDGPVGVYAGSALSSYLVDLLQNRPEAIERTSSVQVLTANDKDYLATRVAYALNLEGPAVTVQTACSTSLVAVHLACQSLIAGECEIALAGGAAINTRGRLGYLHEEGSILSPDGHCRPFSADAAGTVFGSGVGVVVLKRLADALADGDHIRAVILGSAVNNDGSHKIGFTAPRIEGQIRVIDDALQVADVSADDISCIEAHGTATSLGDPIEVAALTRTFRAATDREQFCALGSIKGNFGHLDTAAGVAGLSKLVLALENGAIPPSLNFSTPNAEIEFEHSPFFVNAALRDWPANGKPRRAGVSSFGLGGTNAHVVLEEAPEPPPSAPSRRWQLLVLSARSANALEQAASRLASYLEANPETQLADAAFTLQRGRARFRHRRAFVCRDASEAVAILADARSQGMAQAADDTLDREVVFAFPGQGSQYPGMGQGLYRSEPLYRDIVDDCCARLEPALGIDLRRVLYPDPDETEAARERLRDTAYAQPALFISEYALARLLTSFGIEPVAFIGHSIGEYVAACMAGVFDLDAALDLVATRGRLMSEAPGGSMLAIPLPADEARGYLGDELDLAAVNGPSLSVAAGTDEAIEKLRQVLAANGIEAQRLHTSHAFHSRMMDPVVAAYTERVARVTLSEPTLPFISNVTGTWIERGAATDPVYWGRHLREAVQFSDGLAAILDNQERALLEVGPGRVMQSLVRQHPACGRGRPVVSCGRHVDDEREDDQVLFDAVGQAWVAGVPIDWKALHGDAGRRRIPLPTYPFERERYWIDSTTGSSARRTAGRHDVDARRSLDHWFYTSAWNRGGSPRPLAAATAGNERWLLFEDSRRFASAVGQRLEEMGCETTRVLPGPGFSREDGGFVIDPESPDDFRRLVAELVAGDLLPEVIVHGWSIDGCDTEPQNDASAAHRDFVSLLNLVQALQDAGVTKPLRLAIATAGLHDVTGGESLSPAAAPLFGLSLVIPQEIPSMRVVRIDLDSSALVPGTSVLDQVIDDCVRQPDPVVAYRTGQRWMQDLRETPIPALDGPPGLRDRGVYLITGGLGDIGSTIAEMLGREASARLIVTGRTELPPREKWEGWLDGHAADDSTSIRIERLRKVEASGAEVAYVAADLADEKQMAEAMRIGEERFGSIHGVIDVAGQLRGDSIGPLGSLSAEICREQWNAKLHGLQVLDAAIAGRALDFCLLVSSLSSILGGMGYGAYSAANAYMDAFARCRNREQGTAWLTVNLDAWMDAEARQAPESQRAQQLITAEEGGEVFRRVLSVSGVHQLFVSTTDLLHRYLRWVRLDLEESDAAGEAEAAPQHVRPETDTEYVEPATDMERTLADIWQSVLGIDRVGAHDNFYDIGGNSLLTIQLIRQFEAATGQPLHPTDVVHQTLAQLAASYATGDVVEQSIPAKKKPDATGTSYEVSPFYLESDSRRLFALERIPADGLGQGIVICQPHAHEYERSHRAHRELAIRLVRRGFHTLTFDYLGCGDSEGSHDEARMSNWLADTATAIASFKQRHGLERLSIIGTRLGATLALQAIAGRNDVAAMALWHPIIEGKALIQNYRQATVENGSAGSGRYAADVLDVNGYPFSSELVSDFEAIDISGHHLNNGARTLVLEHLGPSRSPGLDDFTAGLGTAAEYRPVTEAAVWDRDDLESPVPVAILDTIVDWICEASHAP